MMDNETSLSYDLKNSGIKRRRREDLVIRVFKPGGEQHHVCSKNERKYDPLRDNRLSLKSHSPKSIVSTPVEMYRKFVQRDTLPAPVEISEVEGGRADEPIASPKLFRPGWRMSKSSTSNQVSSDKGFFRPSPSPAKDVPSSDHVPTNKRTHVVDKEQRKYHLKKTQVAKQLIRSDSVITVVRANEDQKEEITVSKPEWQRPVYLHGAIRLQEGFAALSARKDSIASLEAFLTMVDMPKPVQESRRVSDDAAEQDIISFFESYVFDREDDRPERFWNEDDINYLDTEDRSRMVNVICDSDDSSGIPLHFDNNECRFLLDDVDPFRDEGWYGDNDAEDVDDESASDNEPEKEVIEIVLSPPIIAGTSKAPRSHVMDASPLLSVASTTGSVKDDSSPRTVVPEQNSVFRRLWHVASLR